MHINITYESEARSVSLDNWEFSLLAYDASLQPVHANPQRYAYVPAGRYNARDVGRQFLLDLIAEGALKQAGTYYVHRHFADGSGSLMQFEVAQREWDVL